MFAIPAEYLLALFFLCVSIHEATQLSLAFESPPPYQSPPKEISSPTSGQMKSSTGPSETASMSIKGLSSDEDASCSPSSPLCSLTDDKLTLSPKSNGDAEMYRKRTPTDKAYFIAKELVMTERTYKKDLELINVWFREEVSKEENMPTEMLSSLFSLIDPLYEFHCSLLRDLEQRLVAWEGRVPASYTCVQGVGDILLQRVEITEFYDRYVEKLPVILERLHSAYCYNQRFEKMYCEFEMLRVCYLPLTAFLLRPLYRLLHYCFLLERFIAHYTDHHPDYKNCRTVLLKMKQVTANHVSATISIENTVKLMELQRDLLGVDNVVHSSREFIREGCLQKLSRKGYQQRMFFLFSDILLYTSRAATPQLQFKVHGQLPLQGVMVEETEPRMGINHCFTIYGGNRALMVAASSEEEKKKWLEDLTAAIQNVQVQRDISKIMYSSLHSCSSSDELTERTEGSQSIHEQIGGNAGSDKQVQHRSNTTVHVCWHRNTSVGKEDYKQALTQYLSGYLLRKFKNSSGWQKLWVVFTNFSLFFYKSYQDDFPLASLPLLGYNITTPAVQDNINRDFVFKLQFKNHIYFFRAESEYTFGRWMAVIKGATIRGNA